MPDELRIRFASAKQAISLANRRLREADEAETVKATDELMSDYNELMGEAASLLAQVRTEQAAISQQREKAMKQ